MGNFGKFIGGGLGWILGGPIGALFGLAVGSIYDGMQVKSIEGGKTTKGDFVLSFLALIAVVLKADGKVLRTELDFVKKYLVRNFGVEQTKEMLQLLRKAIDKHIDIPAVTNDIRIHLDNASKSQLVYFLIELAKSDGEFHSTEKQVLSQIISQLGFSEYEKNSFFAMFEDSEDAAYKVLGLTKEASVDEIKKQYKKLAKEYHPDKVSHLGPEVQEKAKEKFQKIQSAYEKIKKERGFK